MSSRFSPGYPQQIRLIVPLLNLSFFKGGHDRACWRGGIRCAEQGANSRMR